MRALYLSNTAIAGLLAAFTAWGTASGTAWADPVQLTGATPIQHVILILQENRSFDNYFGTYPGADGIPQGTCVPFNPKKPKLGCIAPFHDQHDINSGGPHEATGAQLDVDDKGNGPEMDGFVYEQTNGGSKSCSAKESPDGSRLSPACKGLIPGVGRHDAVGYHTSAELYNYWSYAQHFVLQDQLYESVRGWSGASHLYTSSEWSATCTNFTDVSTCTTNPIGDVPYKTQVRFPWVNLYQLLDKNNVSWKYYLGEGQEPDCDDGEMTCEPQQQAGSIVSIWNPAPGFAYVEAQGANYIAAHNPDVNQFLADVKNGTLPQVSWIVPSLKFSEHPPAGITDGMMFVTSLVNAVMQSPYWQNTAIFVAWDDWGGFYDHVIPPTVDTNATATPIQGYGLRVPGLMISAWAKAGLIDHSTLSLDSYATLIEDLFMNSTRLNPTQMGEPDSRPTIRDAVTSVKFPNGASANVGKLIDEFDFQQSPLPPLVLSTHVPTGITIGCASSDSNNPQNCTVNNVKILWEPVAGKYVPGPFTYHVLRDGVELGGACVTTGTLCWDLGAPSGTHYYTAYSVDQNNVASPVSAGAEADVP